MRYCPWASASIVLPPSTRINEFMDAGAYPLVLSYEEKAMQGSLSLLRLIRMDNAPFENEGYPEQRLWQAIILATLNDYEEWCRRIESSWNHMQQPVNRDFKYALDGIRRECTDKWFQQICDLAQIARPSIFRQFDKFDKEYCVNVIPIASQPFQVLSEWQARKNRHKQLKLG